MTAAALVIALLTAGAAPLGLVTDEAALRREVAEPVFAFVFRLVEADSLGQWTGEDLQGFADTWTRPSDFPLELLASFRREAVPPTEQVASGGYICDRRIILTLTTERLDMPMPYSVLGYHPGTLGFGSPLVIREWRLGERQLRVRTGDGSRKETVRGLTVFQVVDGWTVLDVDAWLDKLLGKQLDDAAVLGFAACRARGRILGVGVNTGRKGRFIYGELDFEHSTVATHGRPLARALASHTRRWTTPDDGDRAGAWRGYD
ncbi:MAG: hypothetical protein GY838_12230 [bacterium]|nr:hypothetical protein [bacterium]